MATGTKPLDLINCSPDLTHFFLFSAILQSRPPHHHPPTHALYIYFSGSPRWFSSKDDIRRVANGRRSHSVTMRTLFFVVTFLRTALTPVSESSTGFRRKNAEGREITSGAICYERWHSSYHLRKLSVWLPDFKNQVFKDPLTFKYHLRSPVEIVNGGFFIYFFFLLLLLSA